MEYLLVSTLSAAAAALIARSKGSSKVLWATVGFVVPVIGPFLALLYRSERDEPRRACPTCGKVVLIYQAICDRCGTELDYPEEVIPPESVVSSSGHRNR